MSGPARWHEAYRAQVLQPDYRFASRHLARLFLDAMTAHARTVARLPGADPEAGARLLAGLAELRGIEPPEYDGVAPDLYFALLGRLEARAGADAIGLLRTGLSRNDLDMTVYKMRARELLLSVHERLTGLRGALQAQAGRHLETVLIAQTHHQPGQPTTLAHYLLAIDAAFGRDLERLSQAYARLDRCPLGAAALAGSSHPLDRAFTAEELGFAGPVENTYDAVASSDWQIDFASVLASVALTGSRFVCDLIAWAAQGVLRMPDGLVQGSSIMPQKRNPVALEHARTRFSRALGSQAVIAFSSHNIPFADLNDFGPDIQGGITSMFLQLDGGLALLHACTEEGAFDEERLERAAAETDTTATELADELCRLARLPFPEAHRLAADLVARLSARGAHLRDATTEDLTAIGGPTLEPAALADALDPRTFVQRRSGLGGPAPSSMRALLGSAEAALAASRAELAARRARLEAARRSLASEPGGARIP